MIYHNLTDTPVALFTFNRLEQTQQTFSAIRSWQPKILLLINDGPREGKSSECDEVRRLLAQIDWPCDVRRNYADTNLGCRRRMISGISWVFSLVEEAILLEDDCLPSQSFFAFASEMLQRYRDNPEIMMVSGGNTLAEDPDYKYSYTFARSVGIWGWATWARAWRYYDGQLSSWPQKRKSDWLLRVLEDREQAAYWQWKFDTVFAGNTTWDYQWLYTVWSQFGLSVIPTKNLIKNIGFTGPKYINPSEWIRDIVSVSAEELTFPLVHPPKIEINRRLDRHTFEHGYAPQDAPYRLPIPLVSIGLPVHNGEPYISQALQSLLKQDYPNLEIIVCDNASTDNTWAICNRLVKDDRRVKTIRNEVNMGGDANFKKVLRLSHGKYFMWAAHDDMWAPSYVRKCVEVLEQYPGVVIACTDVAFIDAEDKVLEDWSRSVWKRNIHTFGLDMVASIHELISRAGWYSIYGLIRSEILLDLCDQGFHKGKFGTDVLMSLDLILRGDFYRVNERLFYYRLHADQYSETQIREFGEQQKKPYTELYQNLLEIVGQSSIAPEVKQAIQRDFVETLGFQNPPILNYLANENIYFFGSCLAAGRMDFFIEKVIVEPTRAERDLPEPETSQKALPDKAGATGSRRALVAYPFQIQSTPRTASEKRCLSLITGLQDLGYRVTLFLVGSPDFYPPLAEAMGVEVQVYLWTEQDAQDRELNSIPWLQTTKRLKQAFEELCTQLGPDFILVSYAIWADLLPLNQGQWVSAIDTIDLFSIHAQMKSEVLKYLQQVAYPFSPDGTSPELLQEDFFSKLELRPDSREWQLYDRYDFTIGINPQEVQLIQSNIQTTHVLSLPFTFEPQLERLEHKQYGNYPILAIGPNEFNYQGYLYFAQKVLPLVREQIPDFHLRVVGDACKHLADYPGIILEGFVPDLDAVYQTAKYAICPLIGATGQQLKVLEAMAHGLPVVALASLAKSLPIQSGVNGFVATNAQEFAQYLIQLETDPNLCQKLGKAALQTIESSFANSLLEDTLALVASHREHKHKLTTSQVSQNLIMIDGVFFQMFKTGIARVWKSLLQEWSQTDFKDSLLVLDRAQTAPKIPGLRYRTLPAFSYQNLEDDRQLLQQICDEENADLFISSYYTTPISTPSVFMGYDMIPEIMQSRGAPVNLDEPMWRAKHQAIHHASRYLAISENTAQDLQQFFPEIEPKQVTVAHCGVSANFSPPTPEATARFKYKYGIQKPYFLTISSGAGGYKNLILFYQALAQLPTRHAFDVVATGMYLQVDPEFRDLAQGITIHTLNLTDEELCLAYGGAIALVYPSSYEGFGMPIAEAMACGCPVITCPNASIPEVAGEAALYVLDQDVDGMAQALCEVQKPGVREAFIKGGLDQAQQFSWQTMADTVQQTLMEALLGSFNLKTVNLLVCPDWSQDEETLALELQQVITAILTHPAQDLICLVIETSDLSQEDTNFFLAGITMNLLMELEIEISEEEGIFPTGKLSSSQWHRLRPKLTARISLTQENPGTIRKMELESLSAWSIEDLGDHLETIVSANILTKGESV